MKTIVWTQYFHCVFSEKKPQTFENAFVRRGPKCVKLFVSVAQLPQTKRTQKRHSQKVGGTAAPSFRDKCLELVPSRYVRKTPVLGQTKTQQFTVINVADNYCL